MSICVFPLSHTFGQDLDPSHPLMKGIEFFRVGQYDDAITTFKYVLVEPTMAALYPDAYFWIAKAYIGANKLDDASKNLEYYLSRYTNHYNYPEALYQKGRLLFLQGDYENAITVLTDFVERYPSNAFNSNAYFWIGESLYMYGNFDDASKVFAKIIQSYPDSFKLEAAKYRIALIEFKKREDELLKLLKWSHMETMKTQDEYSKREQTYEQAIATYQKKLALAETTKGTTVQGTVAVTDKNVQAELESKNKDIQRLKLENEALKKQIEYLQAIASGVKPFDEGQTGITQIDETSQLQNERRLLKMKEEALALKEELLRVLEQALEGK
jgi:outer membrane protein assembly factor BamD (BamD/ComL family)